MCMYGQAKSYACVSLIELKKKTTRAANRFG